MNELIRLVAVIGAVESELQVSLPASMILDCNEADMPRARASLAGVLRSSEHPLALLLPDDPDQYPLLDPLISSFSG